MSLFKKLLFIFAALFVYLPTSQASGTNKQEYIVAITGDDFVSRALFDAIGVRFNIHFRYHAYPTFGDVLDSIKTGNSDFAPNATFTKARSNDFSFSEPTNIEYTYLFSQQGKALESMLRIAVPVNTVFSDLVRSQQPHLTIVEFDHADHAINLINQGHVDGIVAPINYLTTFGQQGLQAELINDQVAATPVGIATAKGAHLDLVPQFIEYIHSEPVQRLLHQTVIEYQRDVRQKYLLTMVRNSGLDLSKPFTIKLETNFPYVFYENGEIKGITAEILNETCSVLNLKCQIVSQPHESWSAMFNEFRNRDFDAIGPINASESRKAFMNFSAPHFLPTSVLVKRIGYKEGVYRYLSELITERIGAIKGDFAVDKLSRSLPQKEFFYFDHQQALIDALVSNQVDYIAIDSTTLNRLLRDKSYLNIEEDRFVGALYSSNISFGFNQTERGKQLANFFTIALDVIDKEAIIDKYDIQPVWRNLYNAEQDYSTRILFISCSFALFALMGILYLHHLSTTDQLTGLKNRRALERRFRNGMPLGMQLLYIDVNHFKMINDDMGHAFGDYVLKCVASQIKSRWRGKAYRVGGDEFILVGRFDDAYVQTCVDGLRTIPLQHVGYKSATVSLSIGVSQGKYNGCDFQSVLKEADLAMYHDKTSGA